MVASMIVARLVDRAFAVESTRHAAATFGGGSETLVDVVTSIGSVAFETNPPLAMASRGKIAR
jgi:hypothetical protein